MNSQSIYNTPVPTVLQPPQNDPLPAGPARQSSARRVGAALETIFGRRSRRRRQSMFPSISSVNVSQQSATPTPMRHSSVTLPISPIPIADTLYPSPYPPPLRPLPPLPPLPQDYASTRTGPSSAAMLHPDTYAHQAEHDWMRETLRAPKRLSARAMLPQVSFDISDELHKFPAPPNRQITPPYPARPEPRCKTPPPDSLPKRRGHSGSPRHLRHAASLDEVMGHIIAQSPTKERPVSSLQIALVYVLANEGQAYVNDPLDHGGPTRYGITLSTLSHYLGRTATIQEVQNISQQTVTDIYRRYYWAPIKGDQIVDQKVATALVDMAVLSGVSAATKLIQAALGCAIDGIMGPQTLAALNASEPAKTLAALSVKACGYFAAIALRDASQAKFLPGWQLRAHKMLCQADLQA